MAEVRPILCVYVKFDSHTMKHMLTRTHKCVHLYPGRPKLQIHSVQEDAVHKFSEVDHEKMPHKALSEDPHP